MKNTFKGLFVPLVTPFKKEQIDYVSLKKLIEYCLANGADGFVALGTTAETPTISQAERLEVINFILENANGKPVIVGAGSNCTKEAVRLTKLACSLGADGVLSVCPYYNKPSKTGIIRHFLEVADCVNTPIILYNVPSRTGIDIDKNVIKTLSKHPNVVGIKEASPDENKLKILSPLLSDEFALFCGNDSLTISSLNAGAVGIISAAANLIPKVFSDVLTLYFSGEKQSAQGVFNKHIELINALYVETNPAPIKYALNKLLGFENTLRLPMCPISRKNEQYLNKLLLNL